MKILLLIDSEKYILLRSFHRTHQQFLRITHAVSSTQSTFLRNSSPLMVSHCCRRLCANTYLRYRSRVVWPKTLFWEKPSTLVIGVGSQVRKNKLKFLSPNKISELQHKKYLALYNYLQSDWLTWADRNEVRSKIFKMIFSISPSQLCSHTPSALKAGAKRSDVPYGHASMLVLGEGSEATEPYNIWSIVSDLCNPNSFSDLCSPNFFFGLVQPKFIFGLVKIRLVIGQQVYKKLQPSVLIIWPCQSARTSLTLITILSG